MFVVYMTWQGDVVQCVPTLRVAFNFEAHDDARNLHSGCDSTSKISDPSLVLLVHKGHIVGVS